jgi:protein piccolo
LFLTYFLFLSQDNKRRTKPILKNLNPEWNYTVIYPNVHKEELKYKTLEFTAWDYDRFKSNDFLGKVSIDLNGKVCFFHLKN